MGCEGGGHPHVETRTLGGADARSRGTKEEEDGTSPEGPPGLPRGLGQTALGIWTALRGGGSTEREDAPHSQLRCHTVHGNSACTHTYAHIRNKPYMLTAVQCFLIFSTLVHLRKQQKADI